MNSSRTLNIKQQSTKNVGIMAAKYMTEKQKKKQEMLEDRVNAPQSEITGEEGDLYGLGSGRRRNTQKQLVEENAMKKKASDEKFIASLNDCYQKMAENSDDETEREEYEQSEKDQIASVATRVCEMDYNEFVEPKNVDKTHKSRTEKKRNTRGTPVPKELIGFLGGKRTVGGDAILGSKDKIETFLTKTQMCRHVNRLGGCRMKETCRFAHSKDELRTVQCAFGSSCIKRDCAFCRKTENKPSIQTTTSTAVSYSYEYAPPSRTQDRMITTEDTPFEETFSKYKTTLCTFYQEKGYCPRKVCNFAHGKQELRCGYGSSCRNEECTRVHIKRTVKVVKRSVVSPLIINPDTRKFGDVIEETGEIILLKSAPQTRNPDGTLSFLGALLKPAPIKPVRPPVVRPVKVEEKVEEVLEEKFDAPAPIVIEVEHVFDKTFEDDVQIIVTKPEITTKSVEADIPNTTARHVLSKERKDLLSRKNAEKQLAKNQDVKKPVEKKIVEKTEKIEKPQETKKIEKQETKIKIEYVCNDSWDDDM